MTKTIHSDHPVVLDNIRGIAGDLVHALRLDNVYDGTTPVLDFARDLAQVTEMNLSYASAGEILCARARELVLHLEGDLDRDLDPDLAFAYDRAQELLGVLQAATASINAVTPARGPGALAGRLLAAAAWLVPTRNRARYAEEFRSELAEVAQAGGGRFAQLAYALRVAASSVRLRVALASPRREGAAP